MIIRKHWVAHKATEYLWRYYCDYINIVIRVIRRREDNIISSMRIQSYADVLESRDGKTNTSGYSEGKRLLPFLRFGGEREWEKHKLLEEYIMQQ